MQHFRDIQIGDIFTLERPTRLRSITFSKSCLEAALNAMNKYAVDYPAEYSQELHDSIKLLEDAYNAGR